MFLNRDQAISVNAPSWRIINNPPDVTVREEYANPPTVLELSKRIGINRNRLYYGFEQLTGKPISEFIQETRLEEGRRLLRQTDLPISEVSRRVGYKHQGNFSTSIKRHFGLTPKQFRQ